MIYKKQDSKVYNTTLSFRVMVKEKAEKKGIKEISKEEIQAKIKLLSPFVRIEFLEKYLKQSLSMETRKFCHIALVELYESRKLYGQAAAHMKIAGDITASFNEKMNFYLKEAELWIKAENYEKAEGAFVNASRDAKSGGKFEVKLKRKEIYTKQAESFEKTNQRNKALKIYENLYQNSEESEREKLKEKLLYLYEKLGKIQEYSMLKYSSLNM